MMDQIQDDYRAKIRTAILKVLERVSGGALAENILFADSNLHIAPRAELVQWRSELETLQAHGLVVILGPGRLSAQRKIMITDEGRLALAEMQ